MAMNIKPTRSELIKLKRQIKLARSGHNLLKKKRDGLIMEFFEILKRAKTVRKELTEEYKTALGKINIARAVESDLYIKSVSLAVQDIPEIKVDTKNIMGVRVPKIESQAENIAKSFTERGYGLISTSSKIDEAASSYEKVMQKVILAAEVETALKKMLQEIEKTKRRVNALEFAIIPKMEAVRKFITLRLEEMERENIFRMKRMKKAA